MPTETDQDFALGVLSADGDFIQLGKLRSLQETLQDEVVETAEIPDVHKEWSMEFAIEPTKTHKELKKFIEAVHPSLKYIILWEKKYCCNNWRKMHGFPMYRKGLNLR